MGEQVSIDVVNKYNTTTHLSAAIKRLFSIGKDILTAKRAKLSDANFEKLIFMKGNQHHVAAMLAKQEQDAKAGSLQILDLNTLYDFPL
jgi:hypothetical protein